MKIKTALLIIPALLLSSLFFACPQPLDLSPVNVPPGMGVFYLSVKDVNMRAIMPASGLGQFTSYKLEFFAIDANFNTDRPIVTATVPNEYTPVSIGVGSYDLLVTAFSSMGAAATGTVRVVINPTMPSAPPVTLTAIRIEGEGTGTFRWNITLPAGLDIATMRIEQITAVAPYINTINFLDPSNAAGPRPGSITDLPSGNYRLTFVLDKSIEGVNNFERREILHIYQNLETVYNFTFTDAHFLRKLYTVTYIFEDSNTDPVEEDYFHGDFVTPLVVSNKSHSDFGGWYTNIDYQNAFNASEPIERDITLHARWIAHNFGIGTINYQEILDRAPGLPSLVTIYRPGTGTPTSHTFTVPNGIFDSVQWFINNEITPRSSSLSFTLNESAIAVTGTHFLTVEVTIDFVPYSRTITVEVRDTYAIGATGPGGGIIFYHDPNGFTVQGYGNPGDPGYFAEYTAYYLEAAPENMTTTLEWASINDGLIQGLSLNTADGTDWAIGRGRRNASLIIADGVNNSYITPAASACEDFATGSYNDWFLPSRNELNQLYINRAAVNSAGGNLGINRIWSSSQGNNSFAWFQDFMDGYQYANFKNIIFNVRAIRAF